MIQLDRMEEDRAIRLFAALAVAFKDAPTTVAAFVNGPERNQIVSDGLTKLVAALAEAFQPDPAEVRDALVALILFNPEMTPVQFTDPHAHPHYSAKDFKRKDVREEVAGDAKAPFFTEGFLYTLLGKEDARSLLARMKRLCAALGYDYYDLFPPEVQD